MQEAVSSPFSRSGLGQNLLDLIRLTGKLPRDVGAKDLGELKMLDPEIFDFLQMALAFRRSGGIVNEHKGTSGDNLAGFTRIKALLRKIDPESILEGEY